MSSTFRNFIFALTLLSLGTGAIGAKKKAVPIPDLLAKVEAKYKEAGTIEAAVTQKEKVISLDMTKKSSGVIWLKLPKQFRWQTFSPDPNTLVSDGRQFWFYTPPFDESEKGQVVVKKTDKAQSKLLTALLAGSFSGASFKSITEKSGNQFELVPTRGTAGKVKSVTVTIDPEKKVIKEVFIAHRGGNESRITLSRVQLGKKLDSKLFKFITPKRTTVIRE